MHHSAVKGDKRPPVERYEGKKPALGDHSARALLEPPDGIALKGEERSGGPGYPASSGATTRGALHADGEGLQARAAWRRSRKGSKTRWAAAPCSARFDR